MIDTRFMAAEAIPVQADEANLPAADTAEALEQRVRRLEDAVASLQDTRGLEERVVERLAERMSREQAPAAKKAEKVPADAGYLPLPPMATFAQAAPDNDPPPAAVPLTPLRTPWLLFDVYQEVRVIIRMFCDRRYRLSWVARLVLPAVLLMMFFSWLFLAGRLWILGDLLDKTLDIALAFVSYKVLSREARRYQGQPWCGPL